MRRRCQSNEKATSDVSGARPKITQRALFLGDGRTDYQAPYVTVAKTTRNGRPGSGVIDQVEQGCLTLSAYYSVMIRDWLFLLYPAYNLTPARLQRACVVLLGYVPDVRKSCRVFFCTGATQRLWRRSSDLKARVSDD